MLALALWHGRQFFDGLVPIRCAACGAEGAHLCRDCTLRLLRVEPVYRPARGACPSVWALGLHEGALRQAVLAVKFRNRRVAGELLGTVLGQVLPNEAEVVVPVPLHPQRLQSRGFNQAEVIASGLSASLGLPLRHALVRRKNTAPQSSLTLSARVTNVAHAFAASREAAELRSARVLLVDDVFTTGETIGACAAALRESGISMIAAAVIALRIGPNKACRASDAERA